MKSLLAPLAGVLLALTGLASAEEANPLVLLQTSQGEVTLELYPQKAPKTVANFLQYVDEGFYDNTLFHRVIDGFMIQGGGVSAEYREKLTRDPIPNEADNGLRNTVGTIAMARTSDPHSATAQFFINVNNNASLDHREKFSSASWGYAVFGRVVDGMAVVGKIKAVATGRHEIYSERHQLAQVHGNVPQEAVVLIKASRIQPTEKTSQEPKQ